VELKGLRMEFATYSDVPAQKGGTTTFGHGAVRKFETSGFEHCSSAPVQDDVLITLPPGLCLREWFARVPPALCRAR